MADDPAGGLQLAAVVLLNLGFSLSVGSVVHDLLFRTHGDVLHSATSVRLPRAGWMGASAMLLGMVGLLWCESAVMGDVALLDAGTALPDVLRGSHFGTVWLAGMVSCLLACACLGWPGMRRRSLARDLLALLMLAVFSFCRALASHAVAHGNGSPWVVVEAVHLLAVATWIGLVLVSGACVLAAPLSEHAAAQRYMARVSGLATWTLALVLLTGALNGWRTLPPRVWPWESAYGRLLLIKLGFVASAACLGGVNRFMVLPRLMGGDGVRSAALPRWMIFLGAILRIEGVVLLGALIAAAALSGTAPGDL